MKSRMLGQAMVEYALCCAVLAVALLVPWGNNDSAVVQLIKALRGYLRGIAFLLSVA